MPADPLADQFGLARPRVTDTILPAQQRLERVTSPAGSRRFVMIHSWYREPSPEKLLVFGVDAHLGANLALSLANRFAVLGLFGKHRVVLDRCKTAPCDPADPNGPAGLVRRQAPQWIIHCGPLARGSWDIPADCPDGRHEARTWARLAEAAAEAGSFLAVISSDAVFAGPRMFHRETAPTTSRDPFAVAVGQAESALEGSNALVVRTHAYGWSPAGTEPSFAERAWTALTERTPVGLDHDRHATPILASDLAEMLLVAYRNGLRGLRHVAGAERTSTHRFACELATAFGLGYWQPRPDLPPRKHGLPDHLRETSLASRRARRELRGPMPMLREGLDRFAEQAANGFRARLQSRAPEETIQRDAA